MGSPVINIPGTTILIKKEDLVSSHISAKVVRSQRIIPADSSEDDFRLEEVKSIIVSLNVDYHSIALATKTEEAEDANQNLQDELRNVSVPLETVLFDESSVALDAAPNYSQLDEDDKKGVDSWIRFYKKHLRFIEKLSDMQIELANAERESEAAAEEMEDVSVSKSSNKELKTKIKLLHENIADDLDKQAERLPKITKRVIPEAEFVINKFDNAYEVAQHMLDTGVITSDVYRTFVQGVARWLDFVRSALETTGPIRPVHGLQFIIPTDLVENENEEAEDGTAYESNDDPVDRSETEEEQYARLEREIAAEDLGKALVKGAPGKIPDNHTSGERIPM